MNEDKTGCYTLKFGEKLEIRLPEIELYSLLKCSKDSTLFSLEIDSNKYNFTILRKSRPEYYTITLLNESYNIISPTEIKIEKNNSRIIYKIYCYENLLHLLKSNKFNFPYIYKNGLKIYINMKSSNKDIILDILENNDENIIYEEEDYSSFLITEETFKENNNYLITEKNINTDEILIPKQFGKYSNEYIKDLNNLNKLFLNENKNHKKFLFNSMYFDIERTVFNFITGSDKIGKTFLSLYASRLENNIIYFNVKKFIELEEIKEKVKILNIFFYEISKIFITYKEYKDFSVSFIEKIKNIINSTFNFDILFYKYIENIEVFFKENKNRYKKLMIILDEVEMDEEKKELFQRNYDLINKIHLKKYNFYIQFTIISPINDNYIKKCLILFLDLFVKHSGTGIETANFRRDPNTGLVNYAYIYFFNLNYSNQKEFDSYKSKLKERINNNIPGKYLDLLNYSLYHINNLESIYNNQNNKNKEEEIEKYIKTIEENGKKNVLNFYEEKNKIYKYNLDKVKECNDIINYKIDIDINKLMELLLYVPIKIISFHPIFPENKYIDLKEVKYKVAFQYNLYNDLISQYLSLFNSPDYYERKTLKPGSKGDKLEEKVIEEIKNGYFKNFKPDYVIEIDSIFSSFKNKKYDEMKKFTNISQYKLILIVQSHSNAERYDIAFLQKVKKDEHQLILGQITKKKKLEKMLVYKCVKNDCIDFSNFFNDAEVDIKILQYHFIFIFQAGLEEDENSMNFCLNNNIKYIKFCIKDKHPIFTNANNEIIKEIIFDHKSYSSVELIIGYKDNDIFEDDSSNISEYSLTGKKRQKVNGNTKAKYFLGSETYNKIEKILGNEFKLINKSVTLKEDLYFQVYYKIINKRGKKERIYLLLYKLNGNKRIINISDDHEKDEAKLFQKIEEPDFNIQFFKILKEKKNKKLKTY